MDKKILLTGFDPFGGEKINPAWVVVDNLKGRYDDYIIHTLQLPTVFGTSLKLLLQEIENLKPDAVICIGQAGGRACITIERIAINVDDASIPDNNKNQPKDQIIVSGGQDGYFTNLPIKAMVEAINQEGIPAAVSNSAGTFVCNHVMYGLLNYIHTQKSDIKGGFIHVPYCSQQVLSKPSLPSMSLKDMEQGILAAINALLAHINDGSQ